MTARPNADVGADVKANTEADIKAEVRADGPVARTAGTVGRLVRPADFERVLAAPVRLRSAHFALHHVADRPLPARPARQSAPPDACPPDTASLSTELSTGLRPQGAEDVDDCSVASPLGCWLGLVVPKRHARRAVTRTLLKRQIRQAVAAWSARLEAGVWVVRQRAPFDPARFPSAASQALKAAARDELAALLARAARGEREVARARGRSSKAPASAGGSRPCAA